MNFLAYYLLLAIATLKLGVYANEVHLSPKAVHVTENTSVTLTCWKTDGQLAETLWTNSQFPGQNSNLYSDKGQCKTTRFLKNNNLFDGLCNGNGTFSVILNRIDRLQHGAVWQCRESEQSLSNTVTVYVAVPVTNVDIDRPNEIYLNENHQYKFKCSTSASWPQPTINWYVQNPKTQVKYNLTENSTQSTTPINEFIAATSLLLLVPNRNVHDWMLYCEAWTNNANAVHHSNQIALNVSYPPDSAPVIDGYENGNIYRFIEWNEAEFSCSVTGGNPLATLNWKCSNSILKSMTIVNKTVLSVVTWKAMRHQNVCSCESHHIFNGRQSTNITLDVLYQPTKPQFMISSTYVSVVSVIKNNILNISCVSEGNPTPNYSWTGPRISNRQEQALVVSNIDMNNGGLYKCTAENRMVTSDKTQSGNNSSSIKVKVLYPPGQPQFRFGNADGQRIDLDTIDVIKRDTFSIFCEASGFPTPDFIWHDFTKGSLLNIRTITSDANMTCNATNRMIETVGESRISSTISTLLIMVLYPPDIPKISVSNKKDDKKAATERIDIIETETIDLECYSNSRPTSNYTWFVNTRNAIQGNVFNLNNISRKDAGNYTCQVNNLMKRTSGGTVAGINSSSTFLNILYPADVGSLSEISLEETSIINITCPVIPGNPVITEIFWTRLSDNRRWKSSLLFIQNVSRADDSMYTCIVFNEMIPTVGKYTKTERNSKFHLNVFFPAVIKTFSEFWNDSKEAIVVNETEEVSFICTTEANPASDITIRSPRNEQIAEVYNSNTLHHTVNNTSYVNAGEYLCTSRNNYTNGHASSSTLILIVRCPPKPSSDNIKDEKIAAILHSDVTLQFTARDYLDEPNKTTFMWFKENVSIENDDRKFVMSSHGLQSNLSITDTTQTDFGKYRVRVSNSVGQYIHFYELVAKDKPEAPKNFAYINDSITDSSVILKWVPAFNGGFPQTFILRYKRITGQQWQNKSITDTREQEMNYTLSGLFSMSEYLVNMFARNEEGDSAYTDSLQFTTKAPISTAIESPSSNTIGIVAGSVSSGVIIVAVAGITVGVFVNRKRNKKETGRVYQNVPFSGDRIAIQRNRESLHVEETLFEGLQEVDDAPIITNEITEYCNSPNIIEKIDRVKVTELFSYVSGRSEESFEADYQKLPTELQKPCTFARKPENIALNRYNGIYPYDHSRVKLHGYPDFFINACYIDGYKSSKAYIASLGPTAKTTSDFKTFWKMIWYERSDVIVMLTNLREPSGMKCEKYWSEEGASIWYGDVCVSSQATECFAEYTRRTFIVSKQEERRSLTHLHYTAWPDKTVPEDVTSLIEFRQRIKETPTSSEGPIVVHCSAGIGRTGTLIALDRLIEEGQDKGSLNVFECVASMREQRVKMVQTFEQYMYIYKALVNALTFDCEAIPVETFNEYVDATNNNMYSLMFQQLRQSLETGRKADVEARLENEKLTNKNRRGADIPGNRIRAMLSLNRADEGSEYINAVYINSFVKKDYFIAAQSPLPCTVADFITMVYQEDCSCIATMEDLKDPGMTVGQYLPDDKKTLTFGNFKVSSSGLETKHNYVVREMKIKYSEKIDSGEKTIYHFQYTKWMTGHDTPVDAREFVQFVDEVKEYANELGEERSHVLVHCLKANERSGLFCALAILMEKIKLERQVNVLNTLRHLRTRRQTAITSMEQLKFCYQATSEYIKMNKLG